MSRDPKLRRLGSSAQMTDSSSPNAPACARPLRAPQTTMLPPAMTSAPDYIAEECDVARKVKALPGAQRSLN